MLLTLSSSVLLRNLTSAPGASVQIQSQITSLIHHQSFTRRSLGFFSRGPKSSLDLESVTKAEEQQEGSTSLAKVGDGAEETSLSGKSVK